MAKTKKKKSESEVVKPMSIQYKERSAYGQGILAWKTNFKSEQNPYSPLTQTFLHNQWDDGWKAANGGKTWNMMAHGVYENLDGVPNDV